MPHQRRWVIGALYLLMAAVAGYMQWGEKHSILHIHISAML